MAVFRIEKTRDYTVMSNYHLRDRSLSLKAKGLLSLMLSLPEDWDYTMKGLARICKDGIDSISGGIRELEAHGYLVRARVRNENGQLGSIEYTILERPKEPAQTPAPIREKPIRENPIQVKPMLDAPNLHDFDTWLFWKWIFKTFCAVLIVTNTWNIVMAVFDMAQSVVNQSAGVIISDAGIDISGVVGNLETTLADWSIGSLLGLWFQSIFVGLCSHILTIAIFLVIYGRMIEVYLTVSVGPIPFATMANREWGQTGQNYLKSLLALGFQAFLIMVCVGIYAVLVQNIAVGDDITVAIWECLGYTVLLCYTLFRTGSLAKSLFGAH